MLWREYLGRDSFRTNLLHASEVMGTYELAGLAARCIKRSKLSICGSKKRADVHKSEDARENSTRSGF